VLRASVEDRDAVLGVNLIGVWNTARPALPSILLSDRPGRVLMCGSVNSVVASPGVAAYDTSKHALVGLAKALSLEFARQGVTVNVVSPAAVATPMQKAGGRTGC
jgi:NAD(P)-dependent dehydrogenase (short-subunit alcohol dehydrogenase family)